ncbi:DUF4214 domain-containing protein [Duganella sp. PWIR1]
MATNTELVQQLYVAYFNRPADVDGLAYYVGVLEASADPVATAAAISADFANATEYKTAYANMSAKQIINTIYHNIFGHEADIPGLNYWADLYSAGSVTLANVVTAVAGGAQGTDAVAYDSKVAAATEFTATIALSADQQIAYATSPAALAAGQTFLAGVTDAATLATAIGSVDSIAGGLVPSVTSALTVGADTIVGKTGNDVFNALTIDAAGANASTLTSFDSVDGGAGNDTLNIYSNNTGAFNKFLATSTTVKNVETINIINTDGTANGFYTETAGAGTLDASKFAGVTVLSQTGAASDIINLAATTTAVYKNLANTDLNVGAADAAKSVAVSLNNFDDAGSLTIATSGAGKGVLNAVTVSGAVVDSASNGVDAIDLDITVGKDVQSLTVNTAADVTLTVNDNGTKVVTTVDASASAGAIAFAAADTVATIKTGAGADDVELNTALTATVKAASVSTGAGNDTITVAIDDAAAAAGVVSTVSVDAGDGKDVINVEISAKAAYTVLAGAGDDKVVITSGVIKTDDKIDGGAGVDSITLANGATLTADDYIVFNKVLLNFETLKLTTAATNVDGSLLGASYTTLDLADTSVITKVTATQALVANGDLDATAAGQDSGASPVVYAGTLNVTEKATGTITAEASVLNLAVVGGKASAVAAVEAVVEGDVKTANITLSAGTDTDTDALVETTLALDVTTTALKGLASLTLSGNGAATVTNTGGTKLVTIDASGLTNVDADGALSGTALDYTSTSTKAETIKLGAGLDVISIGSSLYGGPDAGHTFDSIQGLTLVLDAGGAIDAAKSDALTIVGQAGTIQKFTTTKTDIDLALKDATAFALSKTATDVVFQMGGNTYFVHDGGTTAGSIDAGDIVVKLVGNINLDALILAVG